VKHTQEPKLTHNIEKILKEMKMNKHKKINNHRSEKKKKKSTITDL